jgi:hypothetical protein
VLTLREERTVLLAARSTVALHRLLDVLPALAGDERVTRLFTLVPGSEFGGDVLAAIDRLGGRLVPWEEALRGSYDLVLTASPKGERPPGPRVLLPHGAGFNKSIPDEGSADSASGLDPAFLTADGDSPLVLYALAHPGQLTRLGAAAPRVADTARVVGDPTLERLLTSLPRRAAYRAALRTGPRTLIAIGSTWGPHSLLGERPDLPARLAARLPQDEYQLALIVHPNAWSTLRPYDLAQRLEPALAAGLVLARPHEEWASVLVAADALITDHGSTGLYFAAAGARPVLAACRGGGELLPDSPMGRLLDAVPELPPLPDAGRDAALDAGPVEQALAAWHPGPVEAAAREAFACRGEGLTRLRAELYRLLGIPPRPGPADAAPLPDPAPAGRTPAAYDVRAEVTADGVRVERRPAGSGAPGHHLAAEHGAAPPRLARSAGLLLRRATAARGGGPARVVWTADGWTRDTLDAHPGCRTTAAQLSDGAWLVRFRGHEAPYAVEIGPVSEAGRRVYTDPAVAVSAVHARLTARPGPVPSELSCLVGPRAFPVRIRAATAAEADREV